MVHHLNFILAFGFFLATQISAAPLNERDNAPQGRNPQDGWRCQYVGSSDSGIDPSLDLPGMVAGLCSKVSYQFKGCENFKPDHAGGGSSKIPGLPGSADQGPCPASRWNSALSVCTDISIGDTDPPPGPSDDGSAGHGHLNPKSHESPDAKEGHRPSPAEKQSHEKPPHTDQPNDGDQDGHIYAQNFDGPENDPDNDAAGDHAKTKPEHKRPHQGSEKPQSTPKDKTRTPNNHKEDQKSKCHENERWSSTVDCCVDKSFFSKPNDDNTCKKGDYDSTISLCLDATLLGGLNPAHLPEDPQVPSAHDSPDNRKDIANSKPSGSGHTCPDGQRYSSLVSACVGANVLTKPSSGNSCSSGLQFDLLLGLCLDVSASVNIPGVIGTEAQGHVET